MNKTKLEQLDELMESQIWKDFCKNEEVDSYLEAIEPGQSETECWIYNKETFLKEMEYFSDSISSPDELCWIDDMLDNNPKEVYKLRQHMKYYIKKWHT
tara:strand:- start:214 stop:510 length:297 start_codon:yes stop_codon:yes gene_type:complete